MEIKTGGQVAIQQGAKQLAPQQAKLGRRVSRRNATLASSSSPFIAKVGFIEEAAVV
jgi:hypothetical protein